MVARRAAATAARIVEKSRDFRKSTRFRAKSSASSSSYGLLATVDTKKKSTTSKAKTKRRREFSTFRLLHRMMKRRRLMRSLSSKFPRKYKIMRRFNLRRRDCDPESRSTLIDADCSMGECGIDFTSTMSSLQPSCNFITSDSNSSLISPLHVPPTNSFEDRNNSNISSTFQDSFPPTPDSSFSYGCFPSTLAHPSLSANCSVVPDNNNFKELNLNFRHKLKCKKLKFSSSSFHLGTTISDSTEVNPTGFTPFQVKLSSSLQLGRNIPDSIESNPSKSLLFHSKWNSSVHLGNTIQDLAETNISCSTHFQDIASNTNRNSEHSSNLPYRTRKSYKVKSIRMHGNVMWQVNLLRRVIHYITHLKTLLSDRKPGDDAEISLIQNELQTLTV